MSVCRIILDCLCWIYVVEILPICRDLEVFMLMYIDLMTCIFWRCMNYIRCDYWEFLYIHVVWILMWRRSVYFLNICCIRVFYRFNRSRVLQVGIRAVVGLVRTSIRWISCCMRHVWDLVPKPEHKNIIGTKWEK